MNLDVYQGKINARFKTKFDIPVLYFTQLIGVTLGLPLRELGLGRLAVKLTKPMKRIFEGANNG
jgi:heterodisulfide reductase subunit B